MPNGEIRNRVPKGRSERREKGKCIAAVESLGDLVKQMATEISEARRDK
jgi:hypothetical protein